MGGGARTSAIRRHHHSHHALHRGSRGDGRPHRRHQQGRDRAGRGQGDLDAEARQEAADAAFAEQGDVAAGKPQPLRARALRRRRDAGLRLRHEGRAHRHHQPARRSPHRRHPLQRPRHDAIVARGHLRRPREDVMNHHAIRAIYLFEMARTWRTLLQSIVSPVVSTSLYFVVFGAAIGSRITEVEGVSYGTFIVPGLIMLSVLTQSIANASFGIYFPKFSGTIYEILSAPISYFEIVLGYVGAAATKSIILGLIILATAGLFVPLHIQHPIWMLTFLVLTAVTFSLFGFIIGIWADGFEKLQMIPMLVVTPLTFLGGSFYSIDMLPPTWRTVALLNPVVYLISGFRWSFYEIADVSVSVSIGMTLAFLVICLVVIWWIFRTGYRLKN
nr:hypothetical protein yadH [Bradyrhizobium sp. DOA9]